MGGAASKNAFHKENKHTIIPMETTSEGNHPCPPPSHSNPGEPSIIPFPCFPKVSPRKICPMPEAEIDATIIRKEGEVSEVEMKVVEKEATLDKAKVPSSTSSLEGEVSRVGKSIASDDSDNDSHIDQHPTNHQGSPQVVPVGEQQDPGTAKIVHHLNSLSKTPIELIKNQLEIENERLASKLDETQVLLKRAEIRIRKLEKEFETSFSQDYPVADEHKPTTADSAETQVSNVSTLSETIPMISLREWRSLNTSLPPSGTPINSNLSPFRRVSSNSNPALQTAFQVENMANPSIPALPLTPPSLLESQYATLKEDIKKLDLANSPYRDIIFQFEDTIKQLRRDNSKIKAESAALLYDLKCKLEQKQPLSKASSLEPLKRQLEVPSSPRKEIVTQSKEDHPLLQKKKFTDDNILDIHHQLTAKNQLILQLSIQLSAMEEEISTLRRLKNNSSGNKTQRNKDVIV